MSAVPSCASTDWSRQTTIEWMMLCGWITTSICSGARSNRKWASITSSALFIMVAESTEILRPMTQFGWAQAWSGVTSVSVAGARPRNGPPEAVRTMWSTRSCQVERSSGRHWKIAECSLSIGSRVAPPALTAFMKNAPPTTSASLLARSSRLPEWAAARQGARPAAPTMAAITVSTSSCPASSHRAPAPCRTSAATPASARRRASEAAPSAVATTTWRGRNFRQIANSSSSRYWAVRPTTSKRSGCRPRTSSVAMPTEPVAPRMQTRWRCETGATVIAARAPGRSGTPAAAHRCGPERRRVPAGGRCCPSHRRCA